MSISVMHDIETEDTAATAVVLSIGAVAFDSRTFEIVDTYYVNIDKEDCLQHGLTQSQSTLDWWATQSTEAKARLLTPEPKPLTNALAEYMNWWKDKHQAKYFWGNGSDFDNVILQHAYKVTGLKCWPFWNHRCHRTFKQMFSEYCSHVVREGVHHNALDDAMFQTEQLIAILRKLQELKDAHATSRLAAQEQA